MKFKCKQLRNTNTANTNSYVVIITNRVQITKFFFPIPAELLSYFFPKYAVTLLSLRFFPILRRKKARNRKKTT